MDDTTAHDPNVAHTRDDGPVALVPQIAFARLTLGHPPADDPSAGAGRYRNTDPGRLWVLKTQSY